MQRQTGFTDSSFAKCVYTIIWVLNTVSNAVMLEKSKVTDIQHCLSEISLNLLIILWIVDGKIFKFLVVLGLQTGLDYLPTQFFSKW